MIKYTDKTLRPQYEPKLETAPALGTLYDFTKAKQLLEEIDASGLSEDEKQFLRYAALRHVRFDYQAIAEYYCHASKEMQELMEKSALVIIDVNDAIQNGYLKLTKNIQQIINERSANEG